MTARVLVARLDSMGDVLVSGPAVRAIAAWAEVVMLCGPRGASAARMLPGVSAVVEWDAPWISDPAPEAAPAHIDDLIALVKTMHLTEAVLLTSFHQSPLPLALLLRMAGVERITGASVDYPGSLLDIRVRPGVDFSEDVPEPERALAIAAAAGFDRWDDAGLAVTGVARPPAEVSADAPYVVLHPGAAVPARRWPVQRYIETARLLDRAGLSVVLTGDAGERGLTRRIRSAVPVAVDLAGRLSLPQLAGVLRDAAAVVCGNTGPAHLAAAVRTPVVSLFSPVVPASRWAPYGTAVRVLGDQSAPCRGTRARICPVPGHPCLANVPAEAAVAAVFELLTETRAATRPTTPMGAQR